MKDPTVMGSFVELPGWLLVALLILLVLSH